METNKTEKILIALDYDPSAQKVAEVGFAMAKAMNLKTVLLHVIPDPVYYNSRDYSPIMGFTGFTAEGPLPSDSAETLKKAAWLFLDKARNHLGDPTIQTLVKDGDVTGLILETANDQNAGFIVMGSHSRKWLEKIIMGSVTQKVLLKTSVPVVQVPVDEESENE